MYTIKIKLLIWTSTLLKWKVEYREAHLNIKLHAQMYTRKFECPILSPYNLVFVWENMSPQTHCLNFCVVILINKIKSKPKK